MFKLTFGLLLFCSLSICAAEKSYYTNSLIKLGKLDQEVRMGKLDWETGIKTDKENLSHLKALIEKFGFPTIEKVGKKAHFSAFLIAQHSVSDVVFIHWYLKETKKRLGTGSIVDQTYAYLLDRTNEMANKKQVYGTQGSCVDGYYETSPVENLDALPKLRASVGLLTLADFSKEACSGLHGH